MPSNRRPARPRTRHASREVSPQLRLEELEAREVPALVAAYGFDEGAGAAAGDGSGNGRTGAVSNAAWTAGRYGNALSFNGTNSVVTVADAAALRLTSAMTIEAWVYPTAAATDYSTVILKERGTTSLSYALYAADGAGRPPSAFLTVGGVDRFTAGPSTLPLNTWTHLAATYGGGTLRLYVNGTQVATRSQTGNINTSTAPLRIGGNTVWGEYFTGLIDEVRVYNHALTAAQIQADMAAPVTGTPDATPPTVAVTAPAAGATVFGTVAVSATAADNVAVAGVQFKLDGVNLGAEDTAAPYTVNWNTTTAAPGTHTLTAVARDAAGNTTTATTVTVTVDNTDATPPTVALAAPANNATVAGTLSVTATAADNIGVVGVQFQLDGVNLGAEDTTAPYSVSWNTLAAANGAHILTAVARDAAGNQTTATAVTVTVANDTTAPSVAVTAPADGATVSGAAVAVSADAADAVGVVGVQFLLDGVALGGEDTTAPYAVTWDSRTAANGTHVLTAVARDAAGNATTSAPVAVTVSNADATPPTVSLTAPANGATVSGAAVTVSATAADTVGVVGVRFFLNGSPLGAEDTAAPYAAAWDTTTVANGAYTLTAVARDAAGNATTSAARTVTVSNATTDPAVVGQWSAVKNWPLVAITSVVLKDGRVLVFDGGPDCIGSSTARVWDPVADTFTPVPIPYFSAHDDDIWCSGQALLADGRVLVVGGHDCDGPEIGIRMTNLFDPATMTWTRGPDMAYRRWYPTATTLSDGRVLVTAGSVFNTTDYVPIPEIYDPVTNTFTALTAANRTIPNYAFMFQLPDGRVVAAGSDEAKMATSVLDVASQTWTTLDPTVLDAGSAVMYAPGRIMKAGSSYLSPPADNGGGVPSAATTYVLDATAASPAWQQTAPMASPRTHLNLTVLPDGTVLATGGSTDIGGVNTANAVYTAELWTPATRTWATMAAAQRPRLYHSTAVLLPDGRVLSAGGGHNFANDHAEFNAELYSPAYLFKGPRPVVASAPTTLAYRTPFFVGTPDAATIASVALIRNGSVTHSFNMDQRFVPLAFAQTAGGLTVTAPADAFTAPPGTYMLFLVNGNGVPSVAPLVTLPADSQDPTAPANLVAVGGVGNATLTWAPASDNTRVVRYNVHRGTTASFVPTAANRVAQPTGTSHLDTGLAAGTYYYKVTAEDLAGNVGPVAGPAGAVVTRILLVQRAADGHEWNTPDISVSFPTANTAGNLLIVTGTAARPATTITISDTAGNTYLPAVGPATDPAQAVTAYIWYVPSARGGANTITITPSTPGHAMEIHVSEWSGVNKTSPLDQTSWAAGFGTLASSGPVTPTQDGSLVFGYTFLEQTATAGPGFTPLTLVNGDLDAYQVQTTRTTVSATFTQASDDWLVLAATFKPEFADAVPPSAPADLSAAPLSDTAVGLTWATAADNIGVVAYQVYRSTTPGFTPLPSDLIGQTAGTTFTDAGLPPGTFYYRVVARDAAGNTGPASGEATAGVVGDTTPPAVAVTSPAGGATVAGVVSVAAAASDNGVVAGVQFLLDGNPLGAEVTAAPFAVAWNTAAAPNGAHTLTARARDAAGNVTTSAAVAVTVFNSSLPGLVAGYGFEDGVGTTASDSSPNGLSGTVSGATWVAAGRYGKALSFDGVNDWVTVPDAAALDLTTGMTLEAWVYPTAASTDWATALIKERPGGLAYALYAADGANAPPAAWVNRSGTDYFARGTAAPAVNTWTHLAATYDGATLRLYANGVQVATRALTGALATSTSALRIGGNAVWGEYFRGYIDEVRVYNRALTAAEIQQDMGNPVGGGSPQLPAEGVAPGGAAAALTEAELAPVAAEAVRRWVAAGVSADQAALLAEVRFLIADLNGRGKLGETWVGSPVVTLDDDGAGRGWFVDPTPGDDAEFAAAPPGGYDLLTVAMHELGHVLGLDSLDLGPDSDDLMAAELRTGTRRTPAVWSAPSDAPGVAAPPVELKGEANPGPVLGNVALPPEPVGVTQPRTDRPATPTVTRSAPAAAPAPAADGRPPAARVETAAGDVAVGEEAWGVWVEDDELNPA